jgi:hypothetical protein
MVVRPVLDGNNEQDAGAVRGVGVGFLWIRTRAIVWQALRPGRHEFTRRNG